MFIMYITIYSIMNDIISFFRNILKYIFMNFFITVTRWKKYR
jgi:hypothetical protein